MEEAAAPLGEGGEILYERGRLTTRLVRSDPGSREIEVSVWRFPAVEPVEDDVPPIVQLNGGPGWPGFGDSLDRPGAYEDEILPFTRFADLVVVGQRGTGSSTGTPCPWNAGPTDGLSQEQQDALLVEACRQCREHWEGQGFDLSGFNVIEAAADVEEVRRLLGYERVTLWGGSFGSHWSMAVMRYFPAGVARAVLTEVVRIDGNALRRVALGVTGRVNSRSGVGTWPADVLRMYEGDFEPVARALLGRSGERTGLQTASFFVLDCGSGISPARRDKLLADPAARIVGRLEYLYETACPAWEADLGEEFRRGFETEIPTVVVHGTWDVSTPFENALEYLPFFENLNFVVVEGDPRGPAGGHGLLPGLRRGAHGLRHPGRDRGPARGGAAAADRVERAPPRDLASGGSKKRQGY